MCRRSNNFQNKKFHLVPWAASSHILFFKYLASHLSSVLTFTCPTQSNATGVLNQAQSPLNKVVEGINGVAKVANATADANTISENVQGMSLPVTLQEIQRLATEINNTQVNETAINITYEGASAGLAQARAVEQLSKKAM